MHDMSSVCVQNIDRYVLLLVLFFVLLVHDWLERNMNEQLSFLSNDSLIVLLLCNRQSRVFFFVIKIVSSSIICMKRMNDIRSLCSYSACLSYNNNEQVTGYPSTSLLLSTCPVLVILMWIKLWTVGWIIVRRGRRTKTKTRDKERKVKKGKEEAHDEEKMKMNQLRFWLSWHWSLGIGWWWWWWWGWARFWWDSWMTQSLKSSLSCLSGA